MCRDWHGYVRTQLTFHIMHFNLSFDVSLQPLSISISPEEKHLVSEPLLRYLFSVINDRLWAPGHKPSISRQNNKQTKKQQAVCLFVVSLALHVLVSLFLWLIFFAFCSLSLSLFLFSFALCVCFSPFLGSLWLVCITWCQSFSFCLSSVLSWPTDWPACASCAIPHQPPGLNLCPNRMLKMLLPVCKSNTGCIIRLYADQNECLVTCFFKSVSSQFLMIKNIHFSNKTQFSAPFSVGTAVRRGHSLPSHIYSFPLNQREWLKRPRLVGEFLILHSAQTSITP